MATRQSSPISLWNLAAGSISLWIGGVFMILGGIFLVIGLQLTRTEQAYRTQGLTVDATVLDKSIVRAERGKNSRTRYVVSYRFTSAEGREIHGSSSGTVPEWERLEAGQRLQVTYLPDVPDSNRAEGDNEWIVALVFTGIGGVFALVGGGLAFTALRTILRTVRVSRQGLVAEGTVLSVEPTSTSINRVRQWQIHYKYPDHLGRTQEGASQFLSPDEASAWKDGDRGTIRFDRERPEFSVWMGKA